ncbi:MAG: RNA polymerase sigma factor, partial [Solirubrobacterales bacterium]
MEASALTHASRRGLIARPSRLLRLQKDDRLIAMMRNGHERAFEVLFERYHARLLAFCQHMLSSREDAEDVLQEVFVAAHSAILSDNRSINARPWLYRIARNRCLNHLRKPVPEGQDTMDVHPHENGASTAERVQNREEFRQLVADVQMLPETQRTALLLREVDAMSYEEIAHAMGTTVPSVKSLLVRARITLAESSQARQLTCGEVQLGLAEAAEGLRKVSGPVRQHVRSCEGCKDFRSQLWSDSKALTALFPVGSLAAMKELFGAKLATIFGGGSSA